MLTEELQRFCGDHGVPGPFQVEPIRVGRNSEVLKLSNETGRWILKIYFKHPGDQRDRLGAEYAFLTFLQGVASLGVARPLGKDAARRRALYSFLPGQRISEISAAHVAQAAKFITGVNTLRSDSAAGRLPAAADACFSWQQHLDLAEDRINRLLQLQPVSGLEKDAQLFIREQLALAWQRIKDSLRKEAGIRCAETLPDECRIISPSDFGFHNVLEHEDGLSFVDFEYAGWDDPAKLICDFICQPELPVTEGQGRQFSAELFNQLAHAEAVRDRVQKLLPVHRIKWCCILLNEFRPEDLQRRFHARVEVEGLLANQLAKAKSYFKTHFPR